MRFFLQKKCPKKTQSLAGKNIERTFIRNEAIGDMGE